MIAGGSKGIESSRNDSVSTKRSMSWCVHIEVVVMYYVFVCRGIYALEYGYASFHRMAHRRRRYQTVEPLGEESSCTPPRSTSFPHNRVLGVGTTVSATATDLVCSLRQQHRSVSRSLDGEIQDERGSGCVYAYSMHVCTLIGPSESSSDVAFDARLGG